MSFIFGGARASNQDSLRDYQRRIAGSARGMEREIVRLDRQEKQLLKELTKYGAEGKLELATTKAKEMVRLRSHRSRLYAMKGNMTGLANQLQTVHSTGKIQETIAMTARMLQGLNTKFDAPSVARMLADFEKQNVLMASKQELIEDTLDNTFEVDGELDATSEAVLSVLEEAGLDLRDRMARPGRTAPEKAGEGEDLEERLQRLRPD